jgi:hypothetical protein
LKVASLQKYADGTASVLKANALAVNASASLIASWVSARH